MTSNEVPLLLVDGHSLLYRSWYGFPARIRSRDRTRDLTGSFGFFALLRAAVRTELAAPPEIVVVFDSESGNLERQRIEPLYKAHRPTDPEAMAPLRAIADVHRGLDLLGLPHLEPAEHEADDAIATLATKAAGRPVVIMSLDRDFYQLVDERTHVLNTARPPGRRLIGTAEIQARYAVRPDRWCDRAALVGDPSDGIPGVYGVGPVTAARLLAGGLGVADLPGSGRLTGRVGERVRASLDDVLRWRDLMRLRTDVDVPHEPTGRPSERLPSAPELLAALDLW